MIGALPDLVRRFTMTRPGHTAAVTPQGEKLDTGQLEAAVGRGVEQLRALGAGPGTVVALRGEPGLAWLAALFACWRLGAVAAPLNERQPAEERERARRTLGCDLDLSPGAVRRETGMIEQDEAVIPRLPIRGGPVSNVGCAL